MDWLTDFFISDIATYEHYEGAYNYWLILLSISLAVAASFFSLHFASVAKYILSPRHKIIALISGSLVMAGGIWSMHFVGMLAFDMGHAVIYEPWLTLASILPSIIASYIALNILIKNDLTPWLLIIGGSLVGLGIGTMHYMGMAAMEMDVKLGYDPYWFTFSILIAAVLAIVALSVKHYISHVQKGLNEHIINGFSAIIMGAAISGMHYAGMTGARFIQNTENHMHHMTYDSHNGSLPFAVAVLTILISILATNITSQLRYRQLLLEKTTNELRLKTTLDTAVDGIITIDHKGIIQAFNKAAVSIYGWQEENIIGQSVSLLMPLESNEPNSEAMLSNDIKEDFSTKLQNIKNLSGGEKETYARHKDGHNFPIRLGIGEVKLNGFPPLFVGFVTDISARKKMEDDLRQAKDRAEISAESKSSFLANMSHEIRTPMNAIIGFSDILLDSEMSKENKKHLGIISKSARSLLHLLNDILDSAKLEKNKLELENRSFELIRLVDSAISTLWLQAKSKNIELSFSIENNVGEVYFGAEDRIHQVLMNILGNAIKFTEKGSVTLIISKQPNGFVRFYVQDTGIGIPADRLKAIFDPFTQADASMSRRFGGTGLGTTISKQLVDLMGGEIHALSEMGVGSAFYFDIPLKEVDTLPAAKPKHTVKLPPQRVLIADDVEQNITLLTIILQKQGHAICIAKDGIEAMDQFKQFKPDIILMDIQMPTMDGLTATQIIRTYEAKFDLARTPIIALTANVLMEDRLEAKNAGMDGFANKPIDVNSLTDEMARVLGVELSAIETHNHDESSVPTSHKQIHFKKGLGLWGEPEVYVAELNRFIQSNETLPQTLTTHLNSQAFDELSQLSHAVKGTSSNLALLELSRLAAKLEAAAIAQDTESGLQTIHALQNAMQLIIRELKPLNEKYQETTQESADSLQVISKSDALDMIDELIQLANAGEVKDETLDTFVNSVEANDRNKAIEVKNAIFDFNFHVAIQLLLAMKRTMEGKA